jgi:hypothetical protein
MTNSLENSLGAPGPNEQPYPGPTKSVGWASPSFFGPRSLVEHGAPVECVVARTVHCSLNLPQASRLLEMTNPLGNWLQSLVRITLPCNEFLISTRRDHGPFGPPMGMKTPSSSRCPQNCHLDRSVPGFPVTLHQTLPRVRLSVKERRRHCINATKFDRKSGGA